MHRYINNCRIYFVKRKMKTTVNKKKKYHTRFFLFVIQISLFREWTFCKNSPLVILNFSEKRFKQKSLFLSSEIIFSPLLICWERNTNFLEFQTESLQYFSSNFYIPRVPSLYFFLYYIQCLFKDFGIFLLLFNWHSYDVYRYIKFIL
jgi:hypothetical protein